MKTTLRRSDRRPPSVLVTLTLATVFLAGCSQLVGALASAGPFDTAAANVPSAGPQTPAPAPIPSPGASRGPVSSGGHVASHAFVCVAPVTPGGAAGPPCVPVSDALVIGTAEAILTTTEREAVGATAVAAASAACAGSPPPTGCAPPDAPQGIVTFTFRDGMAAARVLVYRRADGTLGATRLA